MSEGAFSNQSNYIRVVMGEAVTSRDIPDTTLPFGFNGIPMPNISDLKYWDGSALAAMTDTAFPPMPYRFKVTKGSIDSPTAYTGEPGLDEAVDNRLCWGLKHTIAADLAQANFS